jgi:surface carbohydrate biosynthesis protein
MTKIKKLLQIILTTKFKFSKPLKKKILIYDEYSIKFSKILFKKKNYEILRTRFEEINIFILITTIFKHGFINLIFNYKVEYIKNVNPKIVFTSIDNDLNFYKLKSINSISKYNYISAQNGMRDNKFYNICLKFLKNNRQNLLCDHIFVFNNPEKERLSNVIKAKIHVVGNIFNNSINIYLKRKLNSVTFISNGLGKGQNANLSLEKKIFSRLLFLSKKFNFILNFMYRPSSENKNYNRNFFKKHLPKGEWNYIIFNKDNKYKSKYLSAQKMFVFRRSTLGYELMARGKKVISVEKNFPITGHYKKIHKNGFFWINSWKMNIFDKKFIKIFKMPEHKWKKVIQLYKGKLMNYDQNNKKIKHIIQDVTNYKLTV